MGTPKGERRRDALTAAAAELLGSGGFDAVRHRAVAEKAGLPLASTTYYFGSLDELVTVAVERHGRDGLAEGRLRLAALTDPVDDAELVELFLDQLLGPRVARRRPRRRAPALRAARRLRAAALPRPADARDARRVRRASSARSSPAAATTATSPELHDLVAVIDGAVISALIEADPDPRAIARAVLVRFLDAPA